MIRSRIVPAQEGFAQLTERLEARIVEGLDAAAAEAAVVAQAGSTIDLQIETIGAHGTGDGYSAGIRSRKTGRASTALIGEFFNHGTLGKRRRKLKGKRRDSWSVRGQHGTHTAQRGAITPEKGIKPQRFFGKARKAGRARLLEVIHRK